MFKKVLITALSCSLLACKQNYDGRYIAYKVVANDDTFGWVNNLNDTLNNAIKAHLEGSKFEISIKDKYASVTNIDKAKTLLLSRVDTDKGYLFSNDTKSTDTEARTTLSKGDNEDVVFVVEFSIRADKPAIYPVQMGGGPNNLNFKKGRAICYLTPLK